MCDLEQNLHVPPSLLIQAQGTLVNKSYSYLCIASVAKHGKCAALGYMTMQCSAWDCDRKHTLPCHLKNHVQHVYKVTCQLVQAR